MLPEHQIKRIVNRTKRKHLGRIGDKLGNARFQNEAYKVFVSPNSTYLSISCNLASRFRKLHKMQFLLFHIKFHQW